MKINGDCNTYQVATKNLAIAGCVGVLAIAASSLLAGCNSASASVDRANYSTTLNRYYEGRPACLWTDNVTFPVNAITSGQASQRGFDALVDAGLLIRRRPGKGAAQDTYTYDLTKEGYSALDRDIDHPSTGNFCYGRRKVVSIDDDRQASPTTELIGFHYSVAQPASWAKELSIQRSFPQVVSELSGSHKAQAKLLNTDEGWEVSGAPAAIAEPAAAGSSPAAIRPKTLFDFGNNQGS